MTRPFRSRRRTRRALARMRRESESGTRRWGDLTDSGHGRKPAARSRGSALRRHAKFSALQSLENSQNAERTSILCEPALRPCGTSRANEEGVDYGGRLRCPDRLYFLGRRFGSPDDAPLPGSGQQRFSFGKSETRGTVFHVAQRSQPLRRARLALRAAAEAKNLETDTLGLEPL